MNKLWQMSSNDTQPSSQQLDPKQKGQKGISSFYLH